MRQLGALVGDLDKDASSAPSAAVRESIQLLMEVHGAALQRIMELIYEAGAAGEAIILKAGEDPIVRQFLVLYSLHPEHFETRVLKAIDTAGSQLRKLNSEVELLSIRQGAVQVRIHTSGHACGSTAKTVRLIVEESIYDLAPDLTSLEIIEANEEISAGFVSVESLLKRSIPMHAAGTHNMEATAAN
jgi:hypothetical protein